MLYLIITLIFFSFSASASDFEDITRFIEENGIKQSSGSQETSSNLPLNDIEKKLPRQLAFLKAYHDIGKFNAKNIPSSKKAQEIAKTILNSKILEYYDLSYQMTQEACLLTKENKQKCDQLLDTFDKTNEQIRSINGDGEIIGANIGSLMGVSLDGTVVTQNVKPEDPNNALHHESESTLNRNSVAEKGHQIEMAAKTAGDENIADSICRFQKRIQLKLSPEIIKQLVEQLEKGLIDKSISINERKKIYCTLYSYYEDNGLMDKIFEFLLLNMPSDQVFCQ